MAGHRRERSGSIGTAAASTAARRWTACFLTLALSTMGVVGVGLGIVPRAASAASYATSTVGAYTVTYPVGNVATGEPLTFSVSGGVAGQTFGFNGPYLNINGSDSGRFDAAGTGEVRFTVFSGGVDVPVIASMFFGATGTDGFQLVGSLSAFEPHRFVVPTEATVGEQFVAAIRNGVPGGVTNATLHRPDNTEAARIDTTLDPRGSIDLPFTPEAPGTWKLVIDTVSAGSGAQFRVSRNISITPSEPDTTTTPTTTPTTTTTTTPTTTPTTGPTSTTTLPTTTTTTTAAPATTTAAPATTTSTPAPTTHSTTTPSAEPGIRLEAPSRVVVGKRFEVTVSGLLRDSIVEVVAGGVTLGWAKATDGKARVSNSLWLESATEIRVFEYTSGVRSGRSATRPLAVALPTRVKAGSINVSAPTAVSIGELFSVTCLELKANSVVEVLAGDVTLGWAVSGSDGAATVTNSVWDLEATRLTVNLYRNGVKVRTQSSDLTVTP